MVQDLGRITISIGERNIQGTELRRKVLALLCFLVTRPSASATKDEVLEALWPDLDPAVAVNSLNQTVYFLRRVFEPGYKDGLSAGYLHHDSDVLWLDQELIHMRSVQCRAAFRIAKESQDPEATEAAAAQIRQDKSLTPEQRTQTLQALRTSTETTLADLLGQRRARYFAKNAPGI